MFCPNCGTESSNDSKFCMNCGTNLEEARNNSPAFTAAAAVAESPVPAPAPEPEAPPADPVEEAVRNTAKMNAASKKREQALPDIQGRLKKMAGSTLFLVTAIVLTVVLLIGLAQLGCGSGLTDTVYEILESTGMGRSDIRSLMSAMGGLSDLDETVSGFQLLSLVPSILVVIAMWITYISALDTTRERLSTSGLNMIRILYIVMGSILGFTFLFLEIGLLGACNQIPDASAYDTVRDTIGIIGFVFLLLGYGIGVYYYKIVKTVKNLQDAVIYNRPDSELSTGVAVVSIIIGIITAISAFTGGSFLPSAISATAQILCGCLLISIKSDMELLDHEYLQAKYQDM